MMHTAGALRWPPQRAAFFVPAEAQCQRSRAVATTLCRAVDGAKAWPTAVHDWSDLWTGVLGQGAAFG